MNTFSAPHVLGEYRVAVLLVTHAGRTTAPVADVDNLVFDGSYSFAAWTSEVSRGRASIAGDTFGPFGLSSSLDDFQMHAAAQAAAIAAGANLDSYDTILTIDDSGWISGWGGGRDAYVHCDCTAIGTAAVTKRLRFAITHEIGHTLGLSHADGTWCRLPDLTPVTLAGACNTDEYGDMFDPMGSVDAPFHMAAWRKAALGWLDAEEQVAVAASGSYTLGGAYSGVAGPKMLTIPRIRTSEGSVVQYLFLDVRQPLVGSFDATVPLTTPMLQARLGPSPSNHTGQTINLDMRPEIGQPHGLVSVGQVWSDPGSGIVIEVDAVNAGIFTLDITVPPASATIDTTPPAVPTNLRMDVTGSGWLAFYADRPPDNFGLVDFEVQTQSGGNVSTVRFRYDEGRIVNLAGGAERMHLVRVRGVDTAGNRSAYAELLYSSYTTTPAAPTGLSYRTDSRGSRRLTWDSYADSSGLASFRLSKFVNGSWQTVSPVDPDDVWLGHVLDDPQVDTLFGVQAILVDGTLSERATVTVPRVPLPNLQVVRDALTGSIAIEWTAAGYGEPAISGYRMYRFVNNSWQQVRVYDPAGSSYSDWATTQGDRFKLGVVRGDREVAYEVDLGVWAPAGATNPSVINIADDTAVLTFTSGSYWQTEFDVRRSDSSVAASVTLAYGDTHSISLPRSDNDVTYTIRGLQFGTQPTQAVTVTVAARPRPVVPAERAVEPAIAQPTASFTTRAAADTTSPSQPGRVRLASRTDAYALSWGASADAVGVRRYRIVVRSTSGKVLARFVTVAPALLLKEKGLVGSVVVSIRAVDAAGNTSRVRAIRIVRKR